MRGNRACVFDIDRCLSLELGSGIDCLCWVLMGNLLKILVGKMFVGLNSSGNVFVQVVNAIMMVKR